MYTLIIEDRSGNIADEFSFEQGSYTIGRVEGNDIILPSNSVSRNHARIFISQETCYIEDLGSSNGVIVDGEKISARRALANASRIQVGDFTLYLEVARFGPGDDNLRTHVVAGDADTHRLVRVGDMFAGEEFGLTEDNNTIGRTDENFILLSDPSISRRHAAITRQGATHLVEDLGSSNGTRVNGKMIKRATPLRAGDQVQFGNVRFVFAPGNQPVDLQAYAQGVTGGGGMGKLVFLIVLVLLLGVAIALLLYFLVLRGDEPSAPVADGPAPVAEAEPEKPSFDELIESVDEFIEAREYDEALDALITIETIHEDRVEDLQPYRDRVEREQKERQALEQGNRLLADDDLDGAEQQLTSIRDESPYAADAHQALETIAASRTQAAFDAAAGACAEINEACITALCAFAKAHPEHEQARTLIDVVSKSRELEGRRGRPLKEKLEQACAAPAATDGGE